MQIVSFATKTKLNSSNMLGTKRTILNLCDFERRSMYYEKIWSFFRKSIYYYG